MAALSSNLKIPYSPDLAPRDHRGTFSLIVQQGINPASAVKYFKYFTDGAAPAFLFDDENG